MKNVVIVSGHPNYKNSVFNKTILETIAEKCPQVEIRKLDELYPDYNFDIKAEQAALEKADIIIFQYPMHWYGTPGILKLYIDKVMEHGWAYGSKGTALKSKAFIISITVGAPEDAYSASGAMQHTVEEFTYSVESFARNCGLDLKKIFYTTGMMCVPGITTDDQKNVLVEKAKKQAEDILETLKTL